MRSIVGALNHSGFEAIITNDMKIKLMNSAALILPGVGSFPVGMKNLKRNNLDTIIKNFFKSKGKPILSYLLRISNAFQFMVNEFESTKGLNILKW